MILNIKVQPKSSQRKLEEVSENNYKAYLSSPPTDGKANGELINLLAKELGVKKYNIEIIKGLTSRDKVIRIEQ